MALGTADVAPVGRTIELSFYFFPFQSEHATRGHVSRDGGWWVRSTAGVVSRSGAPDVPLWGTGGGLGVGTRATFTVAQCLLSSVEHIPDSMLLTLYGTCSFVLAMSILRTICGKGGKRRAGGASGACSGSCCRFSPGRARTRAGTRGRYASGSCGSYGGALTKCLGKDLLFRFAPCTRHGRARGGACAPGSGAPDGNIPFEG